MRARLRCGGKCEGDAETVKKKKVFNGQKKDHHRQRERVYDDHWSQSPAMNISVEDLCVTYWKSQRKFFKSTRSSRRQWNEKKRDSTCSFPHVAFSLYFNCSTAFDPDTYISAMRVYETNNTQQNREHVANPPLPPLVCHIATVIIPHLHWDSTRKTKTLQRRMCTCWARRNVAHSAPRKGHHCHIAQAKLRSERTLFVNENTALNFVVSISFSCYFFYTWNCFLSFFIPF